MQLKFHAGIRVQSEPKQQNKLNLNFTLNPVTSFELDIAQVVHTILNDWHVVDPNPAPVEKEACSRMKNLWIEACQP